MSSLKKLTITELKILKDFGFEERTRLINSIFSCEIDSIKKEYRDKLDILTTTGCNIDDEITRRLHTYL